MFNALAVSHPGMVVQLPCVYNLQLGAQSQPENCQKDVKVCFKCHSLILIIIIVPLKPRLREVYAECLSRPTLNIRIYFQIAHFNSPEKMQLRTKFVVHYAQQYTVYQSMDGYVFRLRKDCSTNTVSENIENIICYDTRTQCLFPT